MTSRRDAVFSAWAPELPDDEYGPNWTRWIKPVLFAMLDEAVSHGPSAEFAPASIMLPELAIPAGHERQALILDLPGEVSVPLGLACAKRGYRPIPLYNGCPGPNELVDTRQIRLALGRHADALRELPLDATAPPAFLLDSQRLVAKGPRAPGRFDNRWMVFPQDFPSANLLLARRITAILVVQQKAGQPQEDLQHVLRRWQEAGLRIQRLTPYATQPEPIEVERPKRFRRIWYALFAAAGLIHHSAGGFGGLIPQPSSSG
jgi:hypothetical protein